MRVLMVNRQNAYEDFGGDVVQMEQTSAHLRQLGVSVDIGLGPQSVDTMAGYDIIHLFNLQTPEFTYSQLQTAKSCGKKVAVSTIWWDFVVDDVWARSPTWILVRKLLGPRLARPILAARMKATTFAERLPHRQIITGADILLPNADLETVHLARLTAFDTPVHVVPNGIELGGPVDDAAARELMDEHGLKERGFILIAGRVEPVKNQLMYAKAVRRLGLPIVCAGSIREPYGDACRAEGIVLLGRLGQDVLAGLCRQAALHALPSLRETPGLASLEAAAAGTRIVSTSTGSARDYFGDMADYCSPDSPRSMLVSTETALSRPIDTLLAEHVRANFTWHHAAVETLKAYESVLA